MKTLLRWVTQGTAAAAIALVGLVALSSSRAQAGGACRGEPVTTGNGPVVHMSAVCFSPTIVHVDVGATVSWVNDQSDLPHAVTGANASWGSFEELAPNGGAWSYEFANEGTYPYYCVLHPGMIGAVVVGEAAPANVSLAGSATQPGSPPDEDGAAAPWWIIAVAVAIGGLASAGGFALGARRARD